MKNILKICSLVVLFCAFGCNNEDDKDVTPANPVLISPLKDQSCELGIKGVKNTSRLTFQWNRAKNAQSYDLIITNLETGANYITYTDIYDNFKELILDNDIPYSWKVVSKNSGSATNGTSETWKFFFVGEPKANYSPFPANILGPKQAETLTSNGGKVTLSWQGTDPDEDSMKYTIYLDNINGLQAPISALTDLTTSTVQVNVDSGKTYYWRVKSFDGFGNSFSPVYSFKVN